MRYFLAACLCLMAFGCGQTPAPPAKAKSNVIKGLGPLDEMADRHDKKKP